MADSEAKQALLGALGAFLEGDRSMGGMDQVLPALDGYLRVYAGPGFVCAMVPVPPGPVAEYEGVDGVTQAWRDWGGTFESIRADAEEIREGEDAVALFVNQIAVTKHGGVEMTKPSAMVWLFEGGLVNRLEFHLDRDAALGAGGIT